MSTLTTSLGWCAPLPPEPICWCGEEGWSIPHTSYEWWLCESGHEFHLPGAQRPETVIPVMIDPTVIANSMPYGNYIETGTRTSLPRYLQGAMLGGVK